MKNTYLQANLVSLTRINVLLFTSIVLPNNPTFFLEKDDEKAVKLKINRHISNAAVSIYELDMAEPFEYGHRYAVVLEGFVRINVEVSESTEFSGFEDQFYYEEDDLGAIYTKNETRFNLWAPIASEVRLKIEEKDGFHLYNMKRTEKGVYRVALKGDYLNARYHYLVTNSGVVIESNDPWGTGASFNSEYSAVVDVEAIKKMKNIKPTTKFHNMSEAIIYETSIRDFTEDKNTDIVNKGKYLGLCEANRKTPKGNHAGLDYLKLLGVTHVQILPVMDFYGNDDRDSSKSYNWGYNPISFFALEGSYSTRPEDPMNRMIEFKTMVDTLHANDLRVVMDVVYNHLYEYIYTSFEKIVPHYFYRRRANGLPACASGCGNDFASEKKMARKAILESLTYFTDVFDIDGFRFDLMGLMDIETINKGYQLCKAIKDDVIFYGEGWNMGVELPHEKKACSDNADKMPNIGFFNDLFRDTMRGGNFKDTITEKGFIGGRTDRNNVVNYVLRGSAIDIPFAHRFKDYNQSLNYVECHDNNTLYDKLAFSNVEEDQDTLLKRVKFANKLLLFSFGMPFIHMGQEIGLSKSGLDNTYNVLKVNNMDWKLVDERFDMVTDLVNNIHLRKYIHKNFKLMDDKGQPTILDVQYWDNGVIAYSTDKSERIGDNKKIALLINPSLETRTYELDDYYSVFASPEKHLSAAKMKNGILPPLSVQVLYLK